jgi:4-amino-4-deoxy-L-arabinose transferase-like glycosyltransferase
MQPLTDSKNLQHDRERVEQGEHKQETALWQRVALGVILLLALFLNAFQLGQNQFADITTGVNSYYAAAVQSMALNWHNFFFAAFDPQGFLAIDKPPLGFWVQVLSTRVFGFSAWSLLLPEALAGVGSVAVLYVLVRRVFGPGAGLIAALAQALTPISVVASRNNTIDSLLIFVLLCAAWALSNAAETGRVRWLLLSALLALLIARLVPRLPRLKLAMPFASIGMLAVLIAPVTWSALPPVVGNDTIDPLAGPPRPPGVLTIIAHALLPESVHAQPELEHYLLEHQGQASYLVATINASTAAPFILDTGKAVLAFGGFNSFDSILTAKPLAALVARGTVRFFLLPSFAPGLLNTLPADLRGAFEELLRVQQVKQGQLPLPIQPAIIQWVNAHCQVVPRRRWTWGKL